MTAGLDIIDILDFAQGAVEVESGGQGLSVLKQHYLKAARDNNFGVDAVYFSGEFPSVYFKKVPDFQPEVLREILVIQRKIWNQGKVPFLYLESPTEVRVINCYEKPVNPEDKKRTIDDLWLIQKTKNDLSELKSVFDKVSIETGAFWKKEKYARKVNDNSRVDKVLIESLKRTRETLFDEGNGLSLGIIHDLLLRSLFLLYLEDRGATDTALYGGKNGYFEVLNDLGTTYQVFKKLERSFNGNLSPITNIEIEKVNKGHLKEIKRCFWLFLDGLFPDWRIFDFKVIPIQLISEIYEDFLSKAVGKEKKNESGAFYTPHPLAEFVLNEVLPYASDNDHKHDIKILDITCGSGIFLIESLNRLLDRWQFANKNKKLDFETICTIVKDNIFGIEKEKEAIKVAAFSIYLTMLDRLEPKLWQNKQFPYLINEPDEKDSKKQGNNLFRMSSLSLEEDKTQTGRKKKYIYVKRPFEDIEYDLIVGNPPFGGRKVKPDVRAYLEKESFGNETVEAFLHRATQLCPNGKIALISTSKVLFNTGNNHQNFRRFLFNECYVDKVYNFSILRRVPKSRGRNLFASTVRPIGVFFYSAQTPDNPSERLFYCAPSTAIKNRIIDGIAIDPTDVKYLPREECQKPDTKIWKAAMWGTDRDFELIKSLSNNTNLETSLDTLGCIKGVGFQTSKPEVENFEIKELPHIDAKHVFRYYTKKDKTRSIDTTSFERLGCEGAYKKPHIVIKEGQSNKRFCSSYLDFDCSFRKTLYGVHSSNSQILKLLSGYLNSGLASYLMLLTSADWGIEREKVEPNELLDLPDLCFSFSNSIKELIIEHFDEIITLRKKEPIQKNKSKKPSHPTLFGDSIQFQENIETQINQIEQKIESIFWDALNLSETDRILIEDLLDYRLNAFQEPDTSPAFHPSNIDHNEQYAHYLCKTINEFLGYTPEVSVWASVYNLPESSPLNIVVLHLDKQRKAGTVKKLPGDGVGEILAEMEGHVYQEHSESIYYRKFFRYYNYDVVYLIKPNEKRFWTRSMGVNDADEIILEILTSEDEREG